MLSRREFIRLGAMVGGGMVLPLGMAEKVVAFTLGGLPQPVPANPLLVTKFVDPLPVSELLTPFTSTVADGKALYDVGVYQFKAKVHSQMPDTTVWSYRDQGFDPATAPVQNTYLGPAFLVERGTPTEVTWHNNLGGVWHPMPVDPSLHWADPLHDSPPPGYVYPVDPVTGLSTFDYTLSQIPIVPHVHGGEQAAAVDGGPDAWWTPGFTHVGPTFLQAGDVEAGRHHVYPYDNEQLPATIWYHDHALGITRFNVYMGMAGAYVIYDPATEPSGVPSVLSGATDSFGHPYDIPLVIQDRMFDATGQLYYPAVSLNPAMNPFWGPEFFGDHILVNGKVWPFLDVEPREYRFRLLNGSQARFYELSLIEPVTKLIGPAFNVIATDGGYVGTPAVVDPATGKRLVIGTGERIEVVVDFSQWAGKTLELRNFGKTPFPAGANTNPKTTGTVMQFRVAASPVAVPGWTAPAVINPDLVTFPSITEPVVKVRSITLNEWMGVAQPLMMTENNTKWPHEHMGMPGMIDPHTALTEDPKLGTTEVWEIINATADTHPIHLHLVQFQLISRQRYNVTKWNKVYFASFGGMDPSMMDPMGPPYSYEPDGAGVFQPNSAYAMMPGYVAPAPLAAYSRTLSLGPGRPAITIPAPNVVGGNPNIAPFLSGPVMWAPPEERGWKDTVKMNPGEVTRILVRFAPNDNSGAFPFDATAEPGYVWHCHILDHEDNEMMRPYKVTT